MSDEPEEPGAHIYSAPVSRSNPGYGRPASEVPTEPAPVGPGRKTLPDDVPLRSPETAIQRTLRAWERVGRASVFGGLSTPPPSASHTERSEQFSREDVAEQAPETADKAIREYLGAIAFTLVLVGGEMMAEKNGLRFGLGMVLVVAALPIYLSAAWWRQLKPKLNAQTLATLNAVVIRAPWWVRAFFIVGLALILSQFIGRLPFLFSNSGSPPGSANSESVSPERWPALTSAETSALVERVRAIPPEDIVVACETINCRDLADGIAEVLLKTEGWKVSVLHRGGLDITGVTGIQINPNEQATKALKDAIESTTKLKVTIGRDTRKDVGSSQSFLVVGTKPF